MAATPGRWPTAIRASPAAPGTSCGITVDPNDADVIYMPNVALYRLGRRRQDDLTSCAARPAATTITSYGSIPKNSSHLHPRHRSGHDDQPEPRVRPGRPGTTSRPRSSITSSPTTVSLHVYGAQQDTGSIAVPSRTDHGQITGATGYTVGGSESGCMAPDPSDPEPSLRQRRVRHVSALGPANVLQPGHHAVAHAQLRHRHQRRKYRDHMDAGAGASPAREELALSWNAICYEDHRWRPALGSRSAPTSPATLRESRRESAAGPTTVENAKERGYGVVFSIAPSPLKANEIWAGTDTGLLHLTRDGGKTWQNVTPPGLSDWSKIALIEASHFDPAVAYVAVDRHRLDDQKPYIYRTRDYGKTWQPIVSGSATIRLSMRFAKTLQSKGLLFAGTEFGIYVSFDDGDHWQPLQLNLPVTSIRDITIHGDDSGHRHLWPLVLDPG